MPLNGAVIMKDATGITVTAGTSQTFTNDGATIPNGIHLVDAAQTDFRIRRNITAKVKQPTYDAALKTFSKDKKTVTLVQPKLLVNGAIVYNLIRIEREIHPESTVAETLDINRVGAQLLSDLDFDSFWSVGSLL